ncbi:hypothetical protein OROHE_010388 [Orobanche hederae]
MLDSTSSENGSGNGSGAAVSRLEWARPEEDKSNTTKQAHEFVKIIKSSTDRRDYRFVKLENGLCCLVVHDPSISQNEKKAAASMAVGLGSFADPKDAQGLAHFLEHMLFLGSTAFEKENEFDLYLSEHGGFSNAVTGVEKTCYFFDVEGDSWCFGK